MAEITMPKLSDTMTEGTLVAWKKKQGDRVAMGEVIAEVETDKATMEMEAFEDGILSEIYIKEGEKVDVGAKIARIGDKKEEPAAAPAASKPVESAPAPAAVKQEAPAPAPASGSRPKASPLARKVAASKSVDLAAVSGTGPGGRIIQRDVLAAAAATPAPAPVPAAQAPVVKPAAAPAPTLQDKRTPLSGMRKIIADRLLESKTQIPHFYLHVEANAAPLMKLRAEVNASAEEGANKISINDFVLRAVALAIAKTPRVNASFAGDAIVEFGSVHLAVAVAIDDGLVTPVIRDAQLKSLNQISLQVKDFAVRARSKKLKPEEFQGGTFTVSNLGSYGIDRFDAIINPPQAAILSVGNIVKKPVVDASGAIVAGQRVDLGLSCDHRVIDGALGAQFLAALRELIEQPLRLLV
jgi:pyruvate dehydrogenase E2 component (dihydrolipoamide acetyltransferase)